MAGFKGQASYSVDKKGRVAIPAKMRAALGDDARNPLTITRGFEKCIFVFPRGSWSRLEAEITNLSHYDPEARAFVRRTMMWAEEVTLDSQGRISLPKNLVEYADMQQRALILGAFDRLELWDPEVFDAYLNGQSTDYETLAARVMGA